MYAYEPSRKDIIKFMLMWPLHLLICAFCVSLIKLFYFQELVLLKPSNTVFKMMGPVLVKQDIEDAKMNVDKRIKYITSEL